jgi:hypothetical protein
MFARALRGRANLRRDGSTGEELIHRLLIHRLLIHRLIDSLIHRFIESSIRRAAGLFLH